MEHTEGKDQEPALTIQVFDGEPPNFVGAPLAQSAFAKAMALQAAIELEKQGRMTLNVPSQDDWDARHYSLDLSVQMDFLNATISGHVDITGVSEINGLESVDLNLWTYEGIIGDLDVDSVYIDGDSAGYNHANDLLTVYFPEPLSAHDEFVITVFYEAQPHYVELRVSPGIKFKVGFVYERHGLIPIKNLYTLSSPYFAQSWWPCKDVPSDKAEQGVDITITHPDEFVCVANGVYPPREDTNGDGTVTTSWTHGHAIAPYLVNIGITNYEKIVEHVDDIPIPMYFYPERESDILDAEWDVVVPDAMVTFQNPDLFGPYPFADEKYGMHLIGKELNLHATLSMEHQTMSSIGIESLEKDHVLVHELAHQWWGDWITHGSWHHIWLTEGFASYSEALWAEAEGGLPGLLDYMDSKRELAMSCSTSIYVTDISEALLIYNFALQYNKAPWVLHMLRYWMRYLGNEELFFDILHVYEDLYGGGIATTENFSDVCIMVSGDTELEHFFNEWIYGEYFPKYSYSIYYDDSVSDPCIIYLNVRQTQNTEPTVFHMPLDVTMVSEDTTMTFVVYNNQREQDFIVEFPSQSFPTEVDLPNAWVLDSTFAENWSPHIIDRELTRGMFGKSYEDSIMFVGGLGNCYYYITEGRLPEGLDLHEYTGLISGIPNERGTFEFTVYARDSFEPPHWDEKACKLLVYPLAHQKLPVEKE
jgi:aminopeptidase N